jgi:ribonuclease BN (tRNA processing enzyme)
MQLRVLGCSGGIGGSLRTTSFLVDEDILIDCGTGVGDLSLAEMRELKHIFITHTHLDHIADLPLLVDTLFGDLQERPLIIHAQQESMDIIKSHIFNWQIWPDFFELPNKNRPSIEFQAMEIGERLEIEGRVFEMIEVNHTVPAVGYRVSCETGSFAFSGDTTTNNTLWEALNAHDDLDMLIVECAFSNAERELCEAARHYCPESLLADLGKLRHKSNIFVTHLKPGGEEQICNELMQSGGDIAVSRLHGQEKFQL